MKTPSSILVPVDFSEPGEAALDYAVALAGRFGAKVHLLNVVDVQGFRFADLGGVFTPDMVDTIITGNQGALDRLANARRATGRMGEVLLRTGDPRDVIERVAIELGVDLIVMGALGRRGVTCVMLGSVADLVARASPCPVLMVRRPS